METGVVTIQEPVSTKTNVGEAPAAVILDHSSMEVHKVIVEKPVIEEDQTEAKHSPEQGEEIDNVSKAREEIPMKTDEVKEEKDSRTVETSVNGTEAEHNATVSVEEISRNGDNIVNEAVPGDQTATNGESLHDVETTKRVLLEVKKEEEESVPVEAIKNLDDAEQISREVTVDKEKEEDIIQNTEEVQESHKVMETPTKNHEEDIEKISKDTEEHEHVLVRDIPQGETLVTEAETVDTTTVEEARILKTNINETEAHSAVVGEKEGQEIKENTKPSQDLKDDKEQEEIETIKTIISSDEVRSSDVQAKGYGEHTEPCSSEIKDESHGREEYIEVKSKETVPEKETATQVEKEEDKEEMKIDEEPRLDAIEKVETETVKTIIVEEDPEIVNNEETSVHESESFKENAEPVEAIKYSEDAEQTSHEVTVDRENEEEITQKTEEIQERPSVIETSKIQGEDMESTASLEPKEEVDHSSKDTDGHEHELERDIPHCEILKAEAVETNEDIKLILDHKEDKEKEETERVKTVISSDEVRPSAVQEEEFGEHIEPCSSEIKDESHGREESVEVKSKETVQDESTEEKHEDILDVPSTESEKYQDNEPEKALVANTESQEKFEESPSVLALNVDKEEQNDEKIKVDEADGTKIMEEQRGLDLNEPEIEQIDRNRTDETEEIPVAKPVVLQDVESVEQIQKPSPESPSQVSEELSKTVDEKIDEKTEEEEVTLHQEDQEEGSYGLETKKETVSVPESIEIGEKSQEERSVIDLTPLQEESSQPNEQKEETKLEKHELTNEEVKSDEVIEDSSASLSKELEGETVVEAAKIETKKENEEEPAAVDNIQKSPEAVETVESHCSLPSSSEEQEHGTVFEKIEDEKVEEEPMVQIKSHERQGEVSKAVEEQTIDIEPSLTEKYSENIVNEKYALHSAEAAEEETAINGESLHDVETTKRVLPEVEKEEEEAEIKTDAEPRLDVIEKEEIETTKTVVEDAKIFNNEGATAHEYETLKGDNHQDENAKSEEAIKNSDDEEKISSEVIGDREKDEDITQKAEEVQESPRVIEIPTIQGEDNESKTSLELKEEVDKSSKDTEQHEHVLERDIPQCETLKAEAVDTSTVQDAAIFNTLETNISETEAVHTEMSLDLKLDKEQKEAETVKAVIFPDEVRPSDQVHVQEEVFGEHTEPCTLEIKNESQGREESVEVISKETVQDESSEEKDVNLLDVRFGESEKYQENEPVTSLVSKIESGDKFEESVETTYSQTLVDVESVEKAQNTSLETPPELSEETSKTLDEKIEDKPIEEVTLHQEGQDDDSNGLETKEETISVTESRELGEKSREEESCLQNEQEKEVKLQKEQVDKHEPTKEEVYNDQQSPLEEKSDEVIQVSSTSPSEGPEDETVVEAEMIGEEQVADKIQKKFETVETSSLPSSSEEQEHVTVSEKTNGEEVKEAEPIGDMRERGLEIAETTHLSLPSVDQKENVKAFDEELQIPSLTSPLDEQENVTSTEIGETKANETEDDKLDEHVDSSMFSENKDNDTLSAEAKKGEEEIIVGTSKISENVCVQQQEFGTLEATKLEELKEDKSKEIAETTETIEATSDHTLPIKTSQPDNIFSSESVSEQDAHTPKLVEEIHEEETTEAHKIEVMPTGDRDLPVETSQADNTPCSELVSDVDDQTPKQVEEIHEEETKETHKLHSEEILPTDIIPRESSDETLVSILASKEDDQVTLQEDNCAGDVKETKGTQEERPVSVETKESVEETKPKEHVETPTSPIISEKNDNETMIAEGKKGDEYINEKETTMALDSSCTSTTSENVGIEQEEFENHEAPKLEESKEEKIQEIPETDEAIDSTGEHSLPVETSQEYQTPSSDLASGLYDQTPKQIEEVHEEKTKEEHKLFAVDQIRPVETSQEDQTPSLVSEKDYQIPKRVEEIHEEETQKIQAEEILFTETVPRELFSEAPVSMLASGEDEPATPQEGNCAGDKQVEQHVSAETEEMVGETKPKESKAEGTEKSDDQVENSTELTKVEDESRKKTDVEVAELTNDYPIEEAEHGDETYSTLPVVGILTELQNTLETKRAINDSASSEENRIKEPADQEQGKCDAEVESNEKDCVSDIIETEEYKEEVKVQDDISRELEVNVEEKIQEETKEIAEVLPCETIIISSSPLPSEKLEHVISAEKQEEREPQQDFNGSTSEKISLQEEHPRDFETSKEQKEETHEAVKEEDQIVDIKEEKKDKEEQEKFSSKVKKDKEDASKLGIGHDVATPEVEKEEVRCSVLGNVEEIDEVVISEKQIKNPVGVIKKASEAEHESKEEHIETQAISDDTIKSNNDKFSTEQAPKDQREEVSADKYLTKEAIGEQLQIPSSTVLDYFQENSIPEAVTDLADRDLSVKNPSELIQSHQSPNQVEETSFEVEKAQEDKNANVLITNENVQVEDQPKDFEAPAIEKETSEQEQKSNDLTDVQIRGDDVQDIGKNVKPEVLNDEIRGDGHDSVLVPKEETCLIEEKRKVEHVKTEQEDAIKREVFVGEKNKTSENIDRDEAAKEIYQEESKQINTVKEEIKEKEETNQDYFNNVKNSHDAIEKTQSKTGEIKSLSSVSKAQDKSEQKDEVPNQQKREITNEVPKLENPKIAEELQQKDGESENSKDLFSEVKETEPPLKEPARKSLSDLIQKVKGTNKTEDATTEPHIEEESKTVEEDENEDGDHEHDKDDKTSPDSIVMVEAKDTVSIIKTHKKSHGILSGVGSKVKHSISKVKKVLTGKSSHTAKPSSPK